MTLTRQEIMAAYLDACRAEIDALKPGNVHRFADGHRMTADQFLQSAAVSSLSVTDPLASVGQRILRAVTATRESVGTNTNLGILLLCAPLAKAAESTSWDFRKGLTQTLDEMNAGDARDVFAAIRLTNPGGLGSAEEHDVRDEPTVSLVNAMAMAADRDMIARQYTNGFEDIFNGGLSAWREAAARGEEDMWPTIFVFLYFLSSFPDSHIGRKHGTGLSVEIAKEADTIRRRVMDETRLPSREKILLDFDRRLKDRDINPGTSADLTVATLFVRNMKFGLHNRSLDV
ncbi:triphosphoribosyl-dephospho-CoA synthase [Rhizobium sp. SEMIA 4085]|uniref:Triphosphoribosyl-dephospho-CoA synthase protein n=1 Tax=Rhizobium gallicum bv. gallicum R602sp TaxID=1041138 RepID=A0A0B4XES0_9HYPH|nr:MULTISPECIES: triphosphoribosyl-dephospho-CoA synthase [Rhizobium]AJD45596.1 triphosphoribosyl-dephospho-CoA synthase protein [Rhizobium gallicum bv. gallicum R602sp]NNH32934.1 triphosphoribosyl-dephospho-CoA synthase [Rhizobium sp. SEMIA 4085]TDW32852.1 triphosphoribosyl-dephospho-CoA synthase [Rhizobium azibense]